MMLTYTADDVRIRFYTLEELTDIGADCEEGRMIITDTVTSQSTTISMPDEIAGTIIWIALCDPDRDDIVLRQMYEAAEPYLTGIPRNLRPIP